MCRNLPALLLLFSLATLLALVALPASAERPDFVVNDPSGRGGYGQYSPQIAVLADRTIVAVWEDRRNGESDIYAQRFDAQGVPLGGNFRMNGDSTGARQWSPAVAATPAFATVPAATGRNRCAFVVLWLDERYGYSGIYGTRLFARRFDASGAPLGADFQLNDVPGVTHDVPPQVSIAPNGSFVAVWQGDGVHVRIMDADGQPRGPAFAANEGENAAVNPDVAVAANGTIVVAWQYSVHGNWSVYARRFLMDGAPLGGQFVVAMERGSLIEHPAAAAAGDGSFALAWLENHNIMVRLYDGQGDPAGSAFRANDVYGSAYYAAPHIGIAQEGDFVVTWRDRRRGPGAEVILAQRYTGDGTPVGPDFQVSDPEAVDPGADAIGVAADGAFAIAWLDRRIGDVNSGKPDVFARLYGADGVPLGPGALVNDDEGGANQAGPDIGAADDGSFVVVWMDWRRGADYDADLYAQRFAADGSPMEPNLLLVEEEAVIFGSEAAVGVAPDGSFVTSWMDFRSGGRRIQARRFDAAGVALGPNFEVSDDWIVHGSSPAVAVAADHSFVIAWTSWSFPFDIADLYARRFSASGTPLGPPFPVRGPSRLGASHPAAAFGADGTFTIAWNTSRRVYARRYDAVGAPIGGALLVDDDPGQSFKSFPDVACAEDGSFAICWCQRREDALHDIRVRSFDSAGVPTGSSLTLNSTPIMELGPSYDSAPSIALNSQGCYLVAWTDTRDLAHYPDVYAAICTPSRQLQGTDFRLTAGRTGAQWNVAIAALGEQVVSAWADSRNEGQGFDIFAALRPHLLPPGAGQSPFTTRLEPNTPNPFRDQTTIRFELAQPGQVALRIYDVRGALVRWLTEGPFTAGTHTLEWDGRDEHGRTTRPGVFFLRLEVDGRSLMRRVVHLR